MQLTATKKRIKISYRIAEKIEKIKTLEGEMMALVGDYIITGINGEVYPCKPDIFLKTYDLEGQENQSPLTQEDREPRQNWEYEFKKRFSDMVTSAIWYTPVKEFIINLLAAKDREADERVRQLEKKIKLTKEDEELIEKLEEPEPQSGLKPWYLPISTFKAVLKSKNLEIAEAVRLERERSEAMREQLEAIVDGRAFDKETGLIWKHRLDLIQQILNPESPEQGK